jgi:uncharacterized protein (DUF2252 family)
MIDGCRVNIFVFVAGFIISGARAGLPRESLRRAIIRPESQPLSLPAWRNLGMAKNSLKPSDANGHPAATRKAATSDADGGAADSSQTQSQRQQAENPTGAPSVAPDSTKQAKPAGRALRDQTPRSCHAAWCPPADRRDPVEIIIESSVDRVAHLLPIRYGRMRTSPFAFYRGGAAIMAADLARTPSTGLIVQLCGDCHLMNFGVFATPERNLIFDVNDFDETLPGPWEWDVKRLAASFVVAGRHNGFRGGQSRAAVLAMVRSYRERMARFATMRALDVWYESIDVHDWLARFPSRTIREQTREQIRKAAHGVSEHAFPSLVDQQGRRPRIRDNPPLIYHATHAEALEFVEHLGQAFHEYRLTLPDERRVLLDRYHLADHAVKVVGVGAVGTRCGILLLVAGPDDPLFLQVKEARTSVLEPYAGKSVYAHSGQRVVVGQRLMQAASDLFLGWTHGHAGRHFYIRQTRDVKVRPTIEVYGPRSLALYGEACGWVLARAHARSGEPAHLAAYLGSRDRFDQAIADFAEAYADQNERDYDAFVKAIDAGRIVAADAI